MDKAPPTTKPKVNQAQMVLIRRDVCLQRADVIQILIDHVAKTVGVHFSPQDAVINISDDVQLTSISFETEDEVESYADQPTVDALDAAEKLFDRLRAPGEAVSHDDIRKVRAAVGAALRRNRGVKA